MLVIKDIDWWIDITDSVCHSLATQRPDVIIPTYDSLAVWVITDGINLSRGL